MEQLWYAVGQEMRGSLNLLVLQCLILGTGGLNSCKIICHIVFQLKNLCFHYSCRANLLLHRIVKYASPVNYFKSSAVRIWAPFHSCSIEIMEVVFCYVEVKRNPLDKLTSHKNMLNNFFQSLQHHTQCC